LQPTQGELGRLEVVHPGGQAAKGAAHGVQLGRVQRAGRGCRAEQDPAQEPGHAGGEAQQACQAGKVRAPAGAKTRPASTSVAATLLSGSSHGNHSGSRSGQTLNGRVVAPVPAL